MNARKMMRETLVMLWAFAATAFVPSLQQINATKRLASGNNEQENKSVFPNPFKELTEMFSNFDDVVDDFLYKRMGNGEVFYGQRKYKPSNRPNTQGNYSGMGLSDKLRIDVTRQFKEERTEELRKRQQQKRREENKL